MTEVQQPCPQVAQVSGNDAEGRPVLSVLLKRTYVFDDGGHCFPAEDQVPLLEELTLEKPGLVLEDDTDLYPFKALTDLVVKGRVHAPGGAQTQVAWVVAPGARKAVLALGDRAVALTERGRPVFSEPAPFESVPLSYRLAYGGWDAVAERKSGFSPEQFFGTAMEPDEVDWALASPFLYPRNFAGRGYLIEATREAVEALELPKLEDPMDPLTPDRLEAGRPTLWPEMPVPMSTGWLSWGWFPRAAYAGMLRPTEPTADPPMEEHRGWALPGLLGPHSFDLARVVRSVQGASLGLSVPLLRGGETVALENLHPRVSQLRIQLPREQPVLMTDGRKGKLNPTEPVLHHVVVLPDENRLTLVWRGCAPALRPYFNEELDTMPLLARWE